MCALNGAPRYEGMQGSGGTFPCIINIGNRCKQVVSFMTRPLYPRGIVCRYLFSRKQGGTQRRSWCFGEEITSYSLYRCLEIEDGQGLGFVNSYSLSVSCKYTYPQRCEQPTRCNKFRLLIFLKQLNMFRATNSPILRSTFWLYIQSKRAPQDWRGCRPKHVELL